MSTTNPCFIACHCYTQGLSWVGFGPSLSSKRPSFAVLSLKLMTLKMASSWIKWKKRKILKANHVLTVQTIQNPLKACLVFSLKSLFVYSLWVEKVLIFVYLFEKYVIVTLMFWKDQKYHFQRTSLVKWRFWYTFSLRELFILS